MLPARWWAWTGIWPTSSSGSSSNLGVAVIGGVITSTVLTLVAIPTYYDILDETREKLLRLAARIFRGRRTPTAPDPLPEETR